MPLSGSPPGLDWLLLCSDSRSVDAGGQQSSLSPPLGHAAACYQGYQPYQMDMRTESKDDEIHLQNIEQIEEDFIDEW